MNPEISESLVVIERMREELAVLAAKLRGQAAPATPPVVLSKDRPYFERVCQLVCDEFGVERSLLFSRWRYSDIVIARQSALWLLRVGTNWSLNRIAGLAGFDHANVIHACKRVQGWCDVDVKWRKRMDKLLNQLKAEL